MFLMFAGFRGPTILGSRGSRFFLRTYNGKLSVIALPRRVMTKRITTFTSLV